MGCATPLSSSSRRPAADAETAAITGQSRDVVEHYAREVNQKRLAGAAIPEKWEETDAARADKQKDEEAGDEKRGEERR